MLTTVIVKSVLKKSCQNNSSLITKPKKYMTLVSVQLGSINLQNFHLVFSVSFSSKTKIYQVN